MALLSNVQIASAIQAALSASAGSTNTTSNVQNSKLSTPQNGSGSGQVNKIYDGQINIVNNATPTVLDLTALVDPQGVAINFGKVYAIIINGVSVTTGEDITVGGGANPLFTTSPNPILGGADPGDMKINYGSTMKVVDATHKNLQFVTAAGVNVKANVTIVGQ